MLYSRNNDTIAVGKREIHRLNNTINESIESLSIQTNQSIKRVICIEKQ